MALRSRSDALATRTGASVDTIRRVTREPEVSNVDDAAERRERKIGRPSKSAAP
jgi:hypothetical protein